MPGVNFLALRSMDSGVPGVNILALRSITILDRKLKTERIETHLAAEAGVELDFIECDLEAITTDELKNKMRKFTPGTPESKKHKNIKLWALVFIIGISNLNSLTILALSLMPMVMNLKLLHLKKLYVTIYTSTFLLEKKLTLITLLRIFVFRSYQT